MNYYSVTQQGTAYTICLIGDVQPLEGSLFEIAPVEPEHSYSIGLYIVTRVVGDTYTIRPLTDVSSPLSSGNYKFTSIAWEKCEGCGE